MDHNIQVVNNLVEAIQKGEDRLEMRKSISDSGNDSQSLQKSARAMLLDAVEIEDITRAKALLEAIKFLSHGSIDYDLWMDAIRMDNYTKQADFLIDNGIKIGEKVVSNAISWRWYSLSDDIREKKLELIKFLVLHGGEIGKKAVWEAVRNNDPELAKCLVTHGGEIGKDSIEKAAFNNNLELVKFLVTYGGEIGKDSVVSAASNNNLELVKFLIDSGAEIGEHALERPVRENNKEIVNFLINNNGCEISEHDVSNAVTANNTEIAKLLIDKGGEIGWNEVSKAVKNNNPELVELLINGGGRVGEDDVPRAVANNNLELVKLLIDNGGEIGKYDVSQAVENNNPELVKFVIKRGGKLTQNKFNDDVLKAVAHNNLELLKLLVANGGEIRANSVSEAVAHNNLEVIKFMIKMGINIRKYDASQAILSIENDLAVALALDYDDITYLRQNIREANPRILATLHSLERNGVDLKQLEDKESNIFESTLKSIMSPPDSYEKVDVRDVDTENLTVAQSSFDTLVGMKYGILKLKNTKAEDVYRHFQPSPGKLDEFITFLNPEHGFLGIRHGFLGTKKENGVDPIGFYPKSQQAVEDIIQGDYRTEYAVATTLFSVAYLATFAVINSVIAISNKCGYKHGIQTMIPAMVSAAITAISYIKLEENVRTIDHKLGKVENEYSAMGSSYSNNHLKVSFIMPEHKTKALENYIETVKTSCSEKSADHCVYHAYDRNCVGFTQNAFQAAGFKRSPFDFFEKEQLVTSDFSSAGQALTFVRLTNKGFINPQDNFIPLEEYLLDHSPYSGLPGSVKEILA